jgi:hypothetical protein
MERLNQVDHYITKNEPVQYWAPSGDIGIVIATDAAVHENRASWGIFAYYPESGKMEYASASARVEGRNPSINYWNFGLSIVPCSVLGMQSREKHQWRSSSTTRSP